MRWLPMILLALTAARHQLVDVLAQLCPDPQFARRALFYAFGGIVAAGLYAVVWALLPRRPWAPAAALACLWGILEESQVAVCRFAAGISRPVSAPMWRGICDSMAGVPMSTVTLAIPVFVAYWWANQGTKNGSS